MNKSKTRHGQIEESIPVDGVQLATCCSETKYKNRDDLLLIILDPGSYVCACFTLSTMPSAPVVWSKKNIKKANNLKHKSILLINAGNANAFTGRDGLLACEKKAVVLSNLFEIDKENIFFASTGVIGEKLPVQEIINKFHYLKNRLSFSNFNVLV